MSALKTSCDGQHQHSTDRIVYLKLQGQTKNFSSKVGGSSLINCPKREENRQTARILKSLKLASRDVTDAKQMRSEDGSDDHRWLMSNLVWYTVVLQRLMIHLCASKASFQGFSLICLPPVVCLRGLFIECAWDYWQVEQLAARCCDWLLSAARWNSKQTISLTGDFLIQNATKLCWLTVEGFFFTANQGKVQLWCGGVWGVPHIKMQLALTSTSVSRSLRVRVIIFWWIFPTVNIAEEMRKFGGKILKFQAELECVIYFSCLGVLIYVLNSVWNTGRIFTGGSLINILEKIVIRHDLSGILVNISDYDIFIYLYMYLFQGVSWVNRVASAPLYHLDFSHWF